MEPRIVGTSMLDLARANAKSSPLTEDEIPVAT